MSDQSRTRRGIAIEPILRRDTLLAVQSPSDSLDGGADPPDGRTGTCALSRLHWLRTDLTLRNTSNTCGRAHPLVVLGGVLMTAAPPALKPENLPRRFLFRVRDPVGDRVRAGHDYRVSLLFPDASPGEVEDFLGELQAPQKNFVLHDCGAVRVRTLADLLGASPLPTEAGEVCLDLLTPLQCEPGEGARAWRFSAGALGARAAA